MDARTGRGLIASLPEPVIRNDRGRPVRDLTQFGFIGTSARDDAPDTVNPNLWCMAKLTMFLWLFQIVDGI